MIGEGFGAKLVPAGLVIALLLVPARDGSGQGNNGNNNNGNNGNQQNGNQQNGNQQTGGIRIDARGVVRPAFSKKRSGKLSKKRLEAAKQALSRDLGEFSPVRKVSLVRLEKAYEELIRGKKTVPPEMQYLAGLQRIEYVFVYPETNDLVIAGPAEGFGPDGHGRMVGHTTGRPPVRLDDLTVAFRAVREGGEIGCSIDPISQNLAALQRYVARNSNPTTPAVAAARYRQMAQVLGMQSIRIWGVPPDSHFAQTLVEADYRMKRVSMNLERVKIRGFKSYLAMLTPTGNSIQRWWFAPLYDAIYQDEAGTAYQFEGQRAQLLSQQEITDAAGRRSAAAFTHMSTQKYAKLFTDKFPRLAERLPVFAELQNLFDLAILAELFRKEGLPEKVGWRMSLFLDPARAPHASGIVPRQVQSVFNYKRSNRRMILGLIGGGVVIDPRATLRTIDMKIDSARRLNGLRSGAQRKNPPEKHPWWWD